MTVSPWSTAMVMLLTAVAAVPVSPCKAQPASSTPRHTVTDGVPGVSIFSPGHWGTIGVTIANPTEQPSEVISSHYFSADPDLQFARRLWIPSHAKRSSWYPVLPPKDVRRELTVPVKSLLIDRSSGREILLKQPGGNLIHDGLLPSQPGNDPVTGMIADPEDSVAALLPQVARVALHLSPRIVRLGGESLPPTVESLQGLDQLVVSSDRPAADAAGFRAIRQWLHDGGRLWVRLECVSPSTVSLLLGEDFPCTVVDRLGLTQWQFARERAIADPDDPAFDPPNKPALSSVASERVNAGIGVFEPPIEMVRVLVPGVIPVHTIDGWPASFWRRSGRGLVLFTTVNPRGWISLRPQEGKETSDPQNPVAHCKASELLQELAVAFLKTRVDPL